MSSCIVRRCSCFGSLRHPYSLLIIIFFKVTPARLWVYDSPVKPVGELFGYLLFSSTMWHSFEIHMAAFLPQILVDSVNRTPLPWWAAIMVGWSPSQKFIWWHGELNKSTAPAMEEAWFRCFSIVHHVKLSPVTSICVCVWLEQSEERWSARIACQGWWSGGFQTHLWWRSMSGPFVPLTRPSLQEEAMTYQVEHDCK